MYKQMSDVRHEQDETVSFAQRFPNLARACMTLEATSSSPPKMGMPSTQEENSSKAREDVRSGSKGVENTMCLKNL